MAAAGQMPSQAPFLIIFQIILWRKAPQAAAHVQPERIRTQGPQLSHTVGEGFRRDRAGTVSLGPQKDWGLVWVDTGQAQPSWCHLVPEEQRAHGRAQPPLCHGKWRENKLPLHLFPGKGWTVVCTVTSGPLTSPTRVAGCAKSSYEALSGTAAVPGTEGQIPSLTLGRQKSEQPWWCPGSGAHPAHRAKEAQGCGSWDFTDTTQWICECWGGGSCRNLPLETH